MTAGPLDETWEAWTARIAADLAALTEQDWLTFSVHVPSRASSTYAAERAPRGWRRGRARPSHAAPVPDVFLQVQRLEGLLALECIGDTEFEGLTDLTTAQQSALADLGWERDSREPEFSRTFAGHEPVAAAGLLRASLGGVLGAGSPADVDVRRPPRG
ncbi:hypothetical protein [Terrabacter sp. MAHUQ-38]|uniref:TY-Chap domain-containing protein n=1 Tax=unclassified Terrabacter TaxID=2630222 RepID=UPI00165E05E4|nr:hypothetical protein [Terrabacter sp. MAHUQ-38]MBC9820809.1 hypothetical protein [Terrabacter sp. MAHUQ-38]